MRPLLLMTLIASLASCTPTDEGGCPLNPREAIGRPCFNEGTQCGEVSLCDPCVSDGSQCESVECKGGTWVELEWPDTCADGGTR